MLELLINGIRYGGWKAIEVKRSLEAVAGSFAVQASERWPGQLTVRPIKPGDACGVLIEGERVITGYVDAVEPSHRADHHELRIQGRDRTADLVDCSATNEPGEWHGLKLERIAEELARPFGVTVRSEVDTGKPFSSFRLQTSESAFSAIERAARHRAVRPVSDGKGALALTRAGTVRVPTRLVRGENIIEASGAASLQGRFSEYIVKGQSQGDDFVFGAEAAAPEGRAKDPNVGRFRPLVVLAEDQGDAAVFQDRARWEASSRAGKARRAAITVQGWKHAGGLWSPNTLVRVLDDFIGINREMLIVSVVFRKDERGTVTRLSLARPEAFQLLAIPETPGDELADLGF